MMAIPANSSHTFMRCGLLVQPIASVVVRVVVKMMAVRVRVQLLLQRILLIATIVVRAFGI